MRILFLHQNFPGQFLHVAAALQRMGGHELVAVVPDTNTRPRLIPTRTYAFEAERARTSVPLAGHYVERVARGKAVAGIPLTLRQEGFTPDLVVGHGAGARPCSRATSGPIAASCCMPSSSTRPRAPTPASIQSSPAWRMTGCRCRCGRATPR